MTPAIDVTCAVIRNNDGKILVVQKGADTDHPLKWEFPGGKTEQGETHEECILREIREELAMDMVICGRLPVALHSYPSKNIRLIPFICDTLDRLPSLTEHTAFKWIDAGRLMTVDFAEADIAVARSYLCTVKHKPVRNRQDTADSQPASHTDPMPGGMNATLAAQWAVSQAEGNPQIIDSLIEASLSADRKQAFRSSWALLKTSERFPEAIYPHLNRLAQLLPSVACESAQRAFLRIISLSGLHRTGAEHHGAITDFCFSAIKLQSSAIAVKAYSLDILSALLAIYPELENELLATIGLMQGSNSAAIRAKIRQITGAGGISKQTS
ncbi:MAG: (deoxy)nucleoside triphosphate pyrophosphohydrolase [Bacteroidales bacterium]|jgi:8-oxo-dGTP diphosphatase|nr:(deoxy)nucleoside triphosphate pyrophosphohydrolase [Bacteroidales bacterium]